MTVLNQWQSEEFRWWWWPLCKTPASFCPLIYFR